MAVFLSQLNVTVLDDRRDQLRTPLEYRSSLRAWGLALVSVPTGFITDYSSVPRWLPFEYALYGGHAKKAAVLHDWAYATQRHPRQAADALFFEAMRVTGLGWRAWPMWLGVRLFGGWAWRRDAQAR
jgi:hypothetical protein